jgi:hypothetical protein
MLGGNSLSGLGIEGLVRAYWRGRGESVTRGDRRQRELEFESPLPPLARPCESDGAGGILAPGLWDAEASGRRLVL